MAMVFFVTVAVMIIGCAALIAGVFLYLHVFDRVLNPYPYQLEGKPVVDEGQCRNNCDKIEDTGTQVF